MFRVDTSTAADSAPAPSPAGTPGYFRSGNPQAGIPATIPGADWFNTMQEELAGLVEHYGLNLDKTDRTQLRQAIEAAIAAATLRYDIASRSQAESGTDNVALMTPLRVAQAVNALSAGLPAGCIVASAARTPPDGYLPCNGAAISRTAYADLFAAIGTAFGAGDGSTTFNVPDLRGEFPRGWDNGRGVDPGRTLGGRQGDDLKPHDHPITVTYDLMGSEGYSVDAISYDPGSDNKPVTRHTLKNVGKETRPRNVAVDFHIKY